MIRLIRAEFLKLRTTQVWFWLLVATVGVAALLVVGQIASNSVKNANGVPDLFASSTNAYVVVFVLGVLGVTTEFRYQTITPTLLQTPSRWAVVGAKLITYIILGIVYALISVLVQIAIAVPWLSAKDVTVDFGNSDVIHAIVGVFGVVALFGIIGIGVGALIRNQIVAVVVGVVFLSVISPILSAIPGVKVVYPYTPDGAATAIVRTAHSTSVGGIHFPPSGVGVLILLVWAIIPAIVGASISMNRDIT